MSRVYFIATGICLLVLQLNAYSQKKDSLVIQKRDSVLYISPAVNVTEDSLPAKTPISQKDSLRAVDSAHARNVLKKRTFSPRTATIYSAVCPGLGQIYNHKYWKVPLVYAAIGIPGYLYFYNKKWFQKTQYALSVLSNFTGDSTVSWKDSLNKVDKQLIPFIQAQDANDLVTYRNGFRKNQDYSLLFFLLFWGLNVADATVDAHLKGFDVNTELSIHIAPSAQGTPSGLGLVFDIHKPKFRNFCLP